MKLYLFSQIFLSIHVSFLYGISTGANEPIADNMLGLYAKDCAYQFCQERDSLSLWMTLVDVCHKK
jgi:hypothetical protein